MTVCSTETWKDIPGYEGKYQASDMGRIRGPRGIKKQTINRSGYYVINLGHSNVKYVHSLVALAFYGPPPPKHEIRHLDGKPLNNKLCNITYGTHSENERDKLQYGGKHKKLTAVDIRDIRARYNAGESRKQIAERYSISVQSVWNIGTRRTFAWLQ